MRDRAIKFTAKKHSRLKRKEEKRKRNWYKSCINEVSYYFSLNNELFSILVLII